MPDTSLIHEVARTATHGLLEIFAPYEQRSASAGMTPLIRAAIETYARRAEEVRCV